MILGHLQFASILVFNNIRFAASIFSKLESGRFSHRVGLLTTSAVLDKGLSALCKCMFYAVSAALLSHAHIWC